MPTGKNAPGETVREAYDFLNSWTATQQLLSDIYTTWPVIALMCGAAFGMMNLHYQVYEPILNIYRHILFSLLRYYYWTDELADASNLLVDLYLCGDR